jgi:hypothetical protein
MTTNEVSKEEKLHPKYFLVFVFVVFNTTVRYSHANKMLE